MKYVNSFRPPYEICTYYLETEAGQTCKAVKLRFKRETDDPNSILPTANNMRADAEGGFYSITEVHQNCVSAVEDLRKLKDDIVSLNISQASAYLALPSLGFAAIGYGKVVKQGSDLLKEVSQVVNAMYEEKTAELMFLNTIISTAVDIDGRQSSDKTIFCPLFEGETPPAGDKMMVRNFAL